MICLNVIFGKKYGAAAAVFSVVGIAFGIWDVVEGANQISNGSELAEEFRNAAEELEGIVNDLIKMDEELRQLKN